MTSKIIRQLLDAAGRKPAEVVAELMANLIALKSIKQELSDAIRIA
jgi:uncharacterized protein YneF (UPF0154 family)